MKIRDLLWFAAVDLCYWRAITTTSVIGLTLLIICGVTIAAFGIVKGGDQVARYRLESRPLALRLLIGDDTYTRDGLTPTFFKDLKTSIDAELDPGSILGVSPFRISSFSFQRAEGDSVVLTGRTLALAPDESATSNLLLKSMPLKSGKGFTNSKDKGILACPDLLKALQFDDNITSLKVWVNAKQVDVPIVGVFQDNLPEKVQYVILENYEFELTVEQPDPRLRFVFTGPLHPKWPDPSDFPPEAREIFPEDLFARFRVETKLDGTRVLYLKSLASPNDQPYLSEWRRFVDQLGTMLDKRYQVNQNETFCQLDTRGQVVIEEKSPPKNYDMAGIYFRNGQDLKRGANTCEAQEELQGPNERRYVDSGIAEQLSELDHQLSARLNTLDVFQHILLFMAFSNLSVIQVLRARQKATEAGMLKAMGVSRGGLATLVLTEVSLIGIPFSVLGVACGVYFGMWNAQGTYDSTEEIARGFHWTWVDIGWVLLCAGAVSVVSALIATLSWYLREADALLRRE